MSSKRTKTNIRIPCQPVSTEQYDTSFDSRNLLESIAQYGYNKVLAQEDKEEILPENIPADIPDSLDIADYVGKVFCVEDRYATEQMRSRKMRRVDIE